MKKDSKVTYLLKTLFESGGCDHFGCIMRKIQASLKRKQSQRFNTDAVDYRILVAGLESSGKSSIVSMIVNKEADHDTEPTRGVSASAFTANALSTNPKTIIFHEIGGHSCCRGLMRYYYKCDAVIFVVDGGDTDRFTKDTCSEEKDSPQMFLTPLTRTPNGSDSSSTSTMLTSNTPLPSDDNLLNPPAPLSPTPSTTTLSLMPPFSPSDTELTEDAAADPILEEGFVRRRSNGILVVHPNSNHNSSSNLNPNSNLNVISPDSNNTNNINDDDTNTITLNAPSSSISNTKTNTNTNSTTKSRFTLSSLKTLSLSNVTPKLQRSVSAVVSRQESTSQMVRAHTTRNTVSRDSGSARRLLQLKQGTSLKPLTMNEAKCNSVQELISKLNYDLKDLNVPFLILYNDTNGDDNPISLNEHRISSALGFDRIIDTERIFNCFPCSAFDKESVYQGFQWLLDTLKQIEMEKKQNAKLMEIQRKLESMDLDKLGPNAKDPRCSICGEPSKEQGTFCSVCGVWMCRRDAMDKMVKRKGGNSKCRKCVGQVSIFGKELVMK